MVLLDVLRQLIEPDRIIVAHVNHHLRAQSSQEAAFLSDYCQKAHLRLIVEDWLPDHHPQNGIEMAARQVRYRFFARIMRENQATILMTAHHANDQAETMLMKMVRGGQLDSLAGIADERPFANGRLIRPLLNVSKAELYRYARERQLTWFEDATNTDLNITRNRYRHLIVPELEKENPRFLAHMADWHQQLTDLLDFAHHQARQILVSMTEENYLQLTAYQKQPALWRPLLLGQWLEDQGVKDLTRDQLLQLDHLLNDSQISQQKVALPRKMQLVKTYMTAQVKNVGKMDDISQKTPSAVVELGQWHKINDELTIGAFKADQIPNNSQKLAVFKLNKFSLPLTLRAWQSGDRIRLKNGGHQPVRRVLINAKVPTDQRRQQLVLTTANGTVLWVVGYKFSWLDHLRDSSVAKSQDIVIAQRIS